LTTFLLTLIFQPALFSSGTKHRRDLPLGSTESTNYADFSRPLGINYEDVIMKIFIDFWASFYHASL